LESKCDGKVYKSTIKANIPYGGYACRDFCLESELFLEASLNDSYFSLNVDFTTDNENSNDCRNANCIAIAFGPSEAIGCRSQPFLKKELFPKKPRKKVEKLAWFRDWTDDAFDAYLNQSELALDTHITVIKFSENGII